MSCVSDALVIHDPNSVSNLKITEDICRELANHFVEDDMWKLKILLFDLFPRNVLIEINTFEELLRLVRTEDSSEHIIAELLYRIKRYDLLKLIGSCKHQLKELVQNSSRLKQEWVNTYYGLESGDLYQSNDQIAMLLNREGIFENSNTLQWFQSHSANNIISRDTSPLTNPTANVPEETNSSEIEKYPLTHSPCGYCIIINNENFSSRNHSQRLGTNIDRDDLKKIFEYFDFRVECKNDLSHTDIKEFIDDTSRMDFKEYDAFVCCILSHGEEGVIFSSDSHPIEYRNKILKPFYQDNCAGLKGKPKMFFIQACQGENFLFAYQSDGSNIPLGDDCVLFMSAVLGSRSWRHTETGSWFINSLTLALKEHGHQESLFDILTKVNKKVSDMRVYTKDKKQTRITQRSIFESTFKKKFVFKKKIL